VNHLMDFLRYSRYQT